MAGRYQTVLLCICVTVLYILDNTGAVPRVTTTEGEIHGVTTQVTVAGSSYNVHKYLGIPFAEPPVGDLRFKKPEARKAALDSPFNATQFGPICPQIKVEGERVVGIEDEDCLYLNVYVPERSADLASGHAVMIWIYGGAFLLGSSNTYEAPHLAAYGNVIYVTINYRVGPLGFLSTMNDNCPGNFGLWDQRLAMQWVNRHISSFGGDVDRITVFGQSAGAISAVVHGMYPENRGLLHRVIAQSGVAEVKFIDMKRDTLQLVHAIADNLGCSDNDPSEIIDCMKKVTWQEYMDVINNMYLNPDNLLFMMFDPVVDGEMIKVDPKLLTEMSKEHNIEEVEFFQSLDLINGFCEFEGGVSMQFFSDDMNNFQPTQETMVIDLIPMANYVFYRKMFSPEVGRLIAHEYTNWSDPYNYEHIRVQYAAIHGDAGFSVPAVVTSRLHASGGNDNSYMYTFLPVPTHRFPTTPDWLPGADHGDETAYIQGIEKLAGIQDWEIQLSYTLMTYWANFAKTG